MRSGLGLIFVFCLGSIQAQDCTMRNGATTTCDCIFTDSGDSTGGYGDNESLSFTICPDDGTLAQITFTQLDLGSNDFLTIYDGNSTLANRAIDLDESSPMPTNPITPTILNTSGCLTITFNSDDFDQGQGWMARVSCVAPCVNPEAVSTTSEFDTLSSIKLCIGDRLNFSASSSIPNAASIVSYNWDFDDQGATSNQMDAEHTFLQAGRYTPSLTVENDEGCYSTNSIQTEILVSPPPYFSGMEGGDVCVGDSACFGKRIQIQSVIDVPSVPPTGTIELPDDLSQVFETTVNINGYRSGAIIQNADDIKSVCVVMEHSYLSDLILFLASPTGDTIRLHNQDGGSAVLGAPYMDPTGTPGQAAYYGSCDYGVEDSAHWSQEQDEAGTGFEYCFTPTSVTTLAEDAFANNTGCYQVPEGNYESVESFDGLIGSDVNGTWKLLIKDQYSSDNGFIFRWSIQFADDLLPPSATVSPVVENSEWFWNNNTFSGDSICIQGDGITSGDLTFSIDDDFGCSYDTTLTITKIDSPSAYWSNYKVSVDDQEYDLSTKLPNTATKFGIWSSPDVIIIDNMFNPSGLDGNLELTYSVTNQGCNAYHSGLVFVENKRRMFFPNAFTPNNDGLNDTYSPIGTLEELDNYDLVIYDRWGKEVFQTNDPQQKWDGKLSGNMTNTGMYSFIIEYSWDGIEFETKRGTFIILP